MKNKISIIIPAYNAENTLSLCLDSVLAQTWHNWEAIIVDDGSVDNTFAISSRYADRDPRFSVLHKENGGQASARNLGMAYMNGDYFTFIDSDDYLLSEMLSQLLACAEKYESDVAVCGMISQQEDGHNVSCLSFPEMYVEDTSEIIRMFLTEKTIFGPVCKLFRSRVFSTVRFIDGIIFEDIEMLSRLYLKAQSMAVSAYVGYVYVIRRWSTTHCPFTVKKFDLLYVTELIEKNISANAVDCANELESFALGSHLTVLFYLIDAKVCSQYISETTVSVEWIRKHLLHILCNPVIKRRRKIYAVVVAMNISGINALLSLVRRQTR